MIETNEYGTYLTDIEIKRQDRVDGLIHKLLCDLCPHNVEVIWNIEYVSEVRDVILDILVNKLNVMTEEEFYPFIE